MTSLRRPLMPLSERYGHMEVLGMTNAEIARRLEQVARLLTEQGAKVFRIQTYRRAAEALRTLEQTVVTQITP